MAETLSARERTALLAKREGWTQGGDGRTISRSFTFPDFSQAFTFITRIALLRKRRTITPTGRTATTRSRSA